MTGEQLPGRLVQSEGPIFGNRVFYVWNDVRHWVPDVEWIEAHGYQWPGSVTKTTDEDLAKLRAGRRAPHAFTDADRTSPSRESSLVMREVAVSFLRGSGVEIGAGQLCRYRCIATSHTQIGLITRSWS